MKIALWIGASLCWFSCAVNAGELLGHISEDTAQPLSDTQPSQSDDRRIIYRVICSPEDEQLPDCEKPIADHETVAQPRPVESADKDPELSQVQEPETTLEPQTPAKSGKSKSHGQKSPRKTKAVKKSKKTSSKKAATKKTPHKKPKH